MESNQYMTENGLVLRLKAVRPVLVQQGLSALEQEWRERKEPVDVPTYSVPTVVGDTDVFQFDEEGLDVPGDEARTRENHAKWARYKDCLARLEAAKGERGQVLYLALGVEFEMPEDDSWRAIQEWAGVKIPENPVDLRVHYLVTEALSQYDLMMIMSQLQILSAGKMVKPEQVEQFQSSLRRAMEKRAGDAVGEALKAIGQLVDGAEEAGDESGAGLGDKDAERMG